METSKVNEIIERITTSFVDDFFLIKESKDSVNNYLSILNIDNIYEYNEFCLDLLDISNDLLNKITFEQFSNNPVGEFISGVLSEMMIRKINKSDKTDVEKKDALVKIELDRYLSKKSK